MKVKTYFLTLILGAFLLNGCVEKTKKYQNLLEKSNNLEQNNQSLTNEMENMLGEIGDISEGISQVKEAQHLLSVTKEDEINGKASSQQMLKLKNDVNSLIEAISLYNEKINRLEKSNKIKSQQLNRIITGLREQLESSQEQITILSDKLEEKEKELKAKGIYIAQLSDTLSSLSKLSAAQREQLNKQDFLLHQVNYLVGSSKQLKDRGIITKHGLFAPPVISNQADKAGFTQTDMREFIKLEINGKKPKILSAHNKDSYELEEINPKVYLLNIKDPKSFWDKTKYLIVQTN